MNAVEIEEAVSALFEKPFDSVDFPFAFLEAFGNKETTIKRLRTGSTNQSDVGGLLQRGNIHIKTCPPGHVSKALDELRNSPATTRHKAKYILATDGQELLAENLAEDVPPIACEYKNLPNQFAFFLPLAGITTVRAIAENAFDIRATGRLNRLYVELLKHNPDWDTDAKREDLNHFFARLIFCYYAEDTNIFIGDTLFTATVEQMSERDGSNVHEVLAEMFRAMNTKHEERDAAGLRNWASTFPYVNGELFSGSVETPKFSRAARSYLIFVGKLDWKLINPDIFGSMIQAVADDEERGSLGMHYTSVPNILKVLNPLFLDDLREKLADAGDGKDAGSLRKLSNLRNRLSRIRVFDPACGSGNFLVIAYKEMREIEAEINRRRGEKDRESVVHSTNFRGIEIRHFAAEIARLALIIAKFQCDVLYRGPQLARADFLPLEKANWITCGNALRLDWLQICPPTGTGVKVVGDDLFNTPLDQFEIDFANAGGETYICGNPPYVGRRNQTKEQKTEIKDVLGRRVDSSASLDYVFCWIAKAADYICATPGSFAFVTTNSVSQGTQVSIFWPHILQSGLAINFAQRSFRWSNNATDNAGVTCVIVGVGAPRTTRYIFDGNEVKHVAQINPYLLPGEGTIVEKTTVSISGLPLMLYGNMPADGNNLLLDWHERYELLSKHPEVKRLVIRMYGAQELLQGDVRFCLWISDDDLSFASSNEVIRTRIEKVRQVRAQGAATYKSLVDTPHQFGQQRMAKALTILAPTICSESREYFPAASFPGGTGTNNQAYALYDSPIWCLSLLVSKLHLVWIATVCGKLKTDYRYSNTLGWNTFPVPELTEANKAELTRRAEEILLAREAHFPSTIADMYDPDTMKEKYPELLAAHEHNDETLERIYIGRRFKNDTERLEKLFEMYTQMTAKEKTPEKPVAKKPAKRAKKGK